MRHKQATINKQQHTKKLQKTGMRTCATRVRGVILQTPQWSRIVLIASMGTGQSCEESKHVDMISIELQQQ